MTNLERFCGNGNGQSVKERQNEDKVEQKGHERRQQADSRGEGGVITERKREKGKGGAMGEDSNILTYTVIDVEVHSVRSMCVQTLNQKDNL